MQLAAAMLGAVALLYLGAAIGYLIAGRPGMGLTFAGFIVANAGLIWDALTR